MKNREEIALFEIEVLELLKNVMDPEIEINIVDLGLIYEIGYDGEKNIAIEMTFSTPSCPLGDTIITNIKETIKKEHPDFNTNVEVVFDPPWSTELVSEEGKKILGM
jgi:metal-sulfur cluster biosynthetic enzyme